MSEPPAERSRGALFLLAAVFAAAGLWFVVGSDEAASPVVRGAKVESFLSQHHRPVLPYAVKIAFGTLELIALIWFLGFSGKKEEPTA